MYIHDIVYMCDLHVCGLAQRKSGSISFSLLRMMMLVGAISPLYNINIDDGFSTQHSLFRQSVTVWLGTSAEVCQS